MRKTRSLAVLLAGLLAGGSVGCVLVRHEHHPSPPPVVVHKPGPPPHAPAHGYRHKHPRDGVELVFHTDLGVYVVIGHDDCWWRDGRYYRWRDGVWFAGARVVGPWTVIEVNVVPGGLRTHKAKAWRKDKKHHPASRGRGRDD